MFKCVNISSFLMWRSLARQYLHKHFSPISGTVIPECTCLSHSSIYRGALQPITLTRLLRHLLSCFSHTLASSGFVLHTGLTVIFIKYISYYANPLLKPTSSQRLAIARPCTGWLLPLPSLTLSPPPNTLYSRPSLCSSNFISSFPSSGCIFGQWQFL